MKLLLKLRFSCICLSCGLNPLVFWLSKTFILLGFPIFWLWETMKSWKIKRGNQKRKSKNYRQHNGQKKKEKRTNNDPQNTTYKTKDQATRTTPKTGGERRCSRRVSSSCSTSSTCQVTLVTNPVISHKWGKDRKVLTTRGTYPWSFVPQIFRNH